MKVRVLGFVGGGVFIVTYKRKAVKFGVFIFFVKGNKDGFFGAVLLFYV